LAEFPRQNASALEAFLFPARIAAAMERSAASAIMPRSRDDAAGD
jgi:hypothetical protein